MITWPARIDPRNPVSQCWADDHPAYMWDDRRNEGTQDMNPCPERGTDRLGLCARHADEIIPEKEAVCL